MAEVAALLRELEESSRLRATTVTPLAPAAEDENLLVQVRLGLAGSLYQALRAKHAPTAQHCLRVALGCSAFALKIGMSGVQRDELEVAALLHDVGKVGVPDAILLKPDALDDQEADVMERHWLMGVDILRGCCASQTALDTIIYSRCWYDGSANRIDLVGEKLPFGSRMLAIIDAFDAMMSDHVYRRSLSLERAFNELYRAAGTQFDPSLVMLFIKLYENDQFQVQQEVVRRWLRELDPEVINAQWKRGETKRWAAGHNAADLFQQKLLDHMHDAVVFIDHSLRITLWNRGAERLTGVTGESVTDRIWAPSMLRIRDEQGRLIRDEECPVAQAMRGGVQWLRRLSVKGRGDNEVPVDAHAIPVVSSSGTTHGLTLLLHDASSEISLEERCQSLHEQATRDPLTQVANRAEFDRTHALFVAAHLENDRPCSLIMADIDRFKQVNDNYGHQAGDEIIQSFARLLQNSCRPGDLVARYGGEEFVLLCADCDNASAAKRAEEIRRAFHETRQPALDGKSATASFGVTEIQPGDTPDTMLRRSDRALLLAKEGGRNRVVQLGTGGGQGEGAPSATASPTRQRGNVLLSQDMTTDSPIDRSIEKLRGFIADHHADITLIEGKHVQVKIGGGQILRRGGDRTIPLMMDLTFEEEQTDRSDRQDRKRSGMPRTRIRLEIRPLRTRDRRQADAVARARQVLISFRSYLMATDLAPQVEVDLNRAEPGVLARAVYRIAPWLGIGRPVDNR